jgi:uncharacterized protein (TIGR03435 family)
MTALLLSFAASLVRAWTWLYTSRLPPLVRDRRRAEIESDLWEFERDCVRASAAAAPFHVLFRLARGIPDDLGWCVEQAVSAGVLRHQTLVMTGRLAGVTMVLGTLFAIDHDITRDRAVVVFAPGLTAQSAAGTSSGVRFDVISVKPNPTGRAGMTQTRVLPGGRYIATNMPIRLLIGQTYQVQSYRLIGGPAWIETDAFDIVATTSRDLSPANGQRPLGDALKALLAERFKLVVHTETRQLPAYALVLAGKDGKLGPNMARSERTDCAAVLAEVAAARAREGPAGPPPPPPPGGQAPPCGIVNMNGMFALDSATPLALSNVLSAELNRKVFDRTGLTGLFNVRLTWTPDVLPVGPLPPQNPPIDPNGPSIFTAVREQLGLKLEPTNGPVEVLVVDHIERPAPN